MTDKFFTNKPVISSRSIDSPGNLFVESKFENKSLNSPGQMPENFKSMKLQNESGKFKRFLKITLACVALAAIILGGFAAWRAYNLSGKIFVGGQENLYQKISGLIAGQTGSLKLAGEKDGQVNILLLGIGGPGHDGPFLSDTIILAQVRPQEQKLTMTTIPRDYLVNTPSYGQGKINGVFADTYENSKNWDDAGKSIREVVEKMSGLEIPYFAVIDFKGFEKIIDQLGGVEVEVERTFTDYTFPDNKFGYLPPVTFKAGMQVMDGKRALIFARSRHAAGQEGTDFARSARQQKIIQAAKDKAVKLNLISDAGKINSILETITDHFHTNLKAGELLRMYDLVKNYGPSNVFSQNLDLNSGILCEQTLASTGAYVITLCSGKTSNDLKNFFNSSFSIASVMTESANIWLADSSTGGLLYSSALKTLESAGLNATKMIYTGKPLQQTVIYAVNDKPQTVKFIKSRLEASSVTLPPPGITLDKSKVDIIVILGGNPPAKTLNVPKASPTTTAKPTLDDEDLEASLSPTPSAKPSTTPKPTTSTKPTQIN